MQEYNVVCVMQEYNVVWPFVVIVVMYIRVIPSLPISDIIFNSHAC